MCVLQGVITTGWNSLNGDDANMVPNPGAVGFGGAGLLGTMGFSLSNNNPAGGDGLGHRLALALDLNLGG